MRAALRRRRGSGARSTQNYTHTHTQRERDRRRTTRNVRAVGRGGERVGEEKEFGEKG